MGASLFYRRLLNRWRNRGHIALEMSLMSPTLTEISQIPGASSVDITITTHCVLGMTKKCTRGEEGTVTAWVAELHGIHQ